MRVKSINTICRILDIFLWSMIGIFILFLLRSVYVSVNNYNTSPEEAGITSNDIWIPVAETVDIMTSLDETEATEFVNVYMDVFSVVRNRNLMPIVLGIMVVESGCDFTAKHLISSARGIGQIIYKYHPELKEADISEKDLTTNLRKSIMATYIVLEKYWKDNDFNYKQAIFAYRGREYDEYYQRVIEVSSILSCKLFR